MKHNGTQGTYHSVPQNLQAEETDEPKKVPSHESVVENGQNVKTSPTPSKELQEDGAEDEKKPMSPLRKFCFILSLLQCVLFIVAFGWLIPCKIPRYSDRGEYSHNWELNIYGETVETRLAVTSNAHKPVALVFGFSSVSNKSVHGIRAVNAFDGSNLWETELFSRPENVVCKDVDINSDSTPDCIVTDDDGKMFAVNAIDGKVIWYMHDHQTSIHPKLVSQPIVGKTCQSNSEPFIYAAVQNKSGPYFFVSVSAINGQIVEVYNLPECAVMPENMMWRNGKDDPEESDHHSHVLVMSCANKAGNGIIYNINSQDFCKNYTSQPFNEMFFKLDIINNPLYPLHIKILKTDSHDNLVALTNDGKLKVYGQEKEEPVPFLESKSPNLMDFDVGQLTNNSLANVVVLTRGDADSPRSLLLLDNTNSRSLQTIPIENGTAISLHTVRVTSSLDTVLLKTVSEANLNDVNGTNATEHALDVKHFEEKYTILECWDTASFRTVSSDLISASCSDNDCKEVFKDKHTSLIVDVDNDGFDELIYFIDKKIPSSAVHSFSLKLVRLRDPHDTSCSSCNC